MIKDPEGNLIGMIKPFQARGSHSKNPDITEDVI
jgi:hypothetical protein